MLHYMNTYYSDSCFFFFSSRRRHTRFDCDWSSDVCSSDLGNLAMDWDFDGEEFDEESKLRDETRKILGLPALPISATCVRVPILIGHAEAVWVETEEALSADDARRVLGAAAGIRLDDFPTPADAVGVDD